jgi:hypothetical protein
MAAPARKVLEEALALTPEQRLDLAAELLASVDGKPPETWEAAWRAGPVLVLDESHELRPEVLGMLRILANFDMASRLVLSLILAGQTPLRALLTHDEHEAMAHRIIHYAQLRLLSRDELAQYRSSEASGSSIASVRVGRIGRPQPAAAARSPQRSGWRRGVRLPGLVA